MAPPELHVIGVDPGGTTGWCLLTVPRGCMYNGDPYELLDWQYGELEGPEPTHVTWLARKVREVQSLAYKVGPAVVVEDWTIQPHNNSTDPETLSPVRIAAMLRYAEHRHELNDGRVILQNRAIAKSTATDDRLRAWGLYDAHSGPHARDATRHAITALRRARDKPKFRDEMWAYVP